MAEPLIHDLDTLRPPPEYVILAGKKIDISFVPSGVALDISRVLRKLQALDVSEENVDETAEEGVEIMADLCALITVKQQSEMTKDWLLANTSSIQLRALMERITDAMNRSIEGMREGEASKKPPADKEKP